MIFSYTKEVKLGFKGALEKVKEELAKEGFGILFEEMASKRFKEKLNVDFDDYVILGVCIQKFAYQVLNIDKEIGLFLPCNVLVYVDKDKTFITTILPKEVMKLIENEKINPIAEEVDKKLRKVIDSV